MNKQWVLDIMKSLLVIAEAETPAGTGQTIEKAGEAAIEIVQKVMAKHEEIAGTPLDLSKLHQIAPLDQPDGGGN